MCRFFLISWYILLVIFDPFLLNAASSSTNLPYVLDKSVQKVVSIYATSYQKPSNLRDLIADTMSDSDDSRSIGSGLIVSADGLIMTNQHLLANHKYITVVLHDSSIYSARVVFVDKAMDLGLLKLDDLSYELPFWSLLSKDVQIGQQIFSIGNPFGIGLSVSSGIVSALPVDLKPNLGKLIQTDAAINPGNSGGALVDSSGDLIGLNALMLSELGGFSGIGFALPIEVLQSFLQQAKQDAIIPPLWLGLSFSAFREKDFGVVINNIYRNSPADIAQLSLGDIITHVNDVKVLDVIDFIRVVSSVLQIEEIKLTVERKGVIFESVIVPIKLPNYEVLDYIHINRSIFSNLTLWADDSVYGVRVILDTDSLLYGFGLRSDDLITNIGSYSVLNVGDMLHAIIMIGNRGPYDITVNRGNTVLNLHFDLTK